MITRPHVGQLEGDYDPNDLPVGTIIGSGVTMFTSIENTYGGLSWGEVYTIDTKQNMEKYSRMAAAAGITNQWVICYLPPTNKNMLPIGQIN